MPRFARLSLSMPIPFPSVITAKTNSSCLGFVTSRVVLDGRSKADMGKHAQPAGATTKSKGATAWGGSPKMFTYGFAVIRGASVDSGSFIDRLDRDRRHCTRVCQLR